MSSYRVRQYIYRPKWFEDYVLVESEEDMEAYLNHRTEIDAEAYARKLAGMIFDVGLFRGGDEDVMKKMKKRAEKITIKITDDEIEYFNCILDID